MSADPHIAPTDDLVTTLVVKFEPQRLDKFDVAEFLVRIVKQVSQLGFEAVRAECAYRAVAEWQMGDEEPKVRTRNDDGTWSKS